MMRCRLEVEELSRVVIFLTTKYVLYKTFDVQDVQ